MGEKTVPTRSLRKRRAVSDRSLCPWNGDVIRLEATVYGQTRKETQSKIVKDFICYMRPLENVLLLIPRGSYNLQQNNSFESVPTALGFGQKVDSTESFMTA